MSDALGMLGFVCLSVAAFTVGVTAGLVAVGACLLFVSWRLERR